MRNGTRHLVDADPKRVGATLRAFRMTRGYKPEQFAQEIGISRPYLANIEAGRKPLTQVLLARAAELLDIDQLAIMRPADEDGAA